LASAEEDEGEGGLVEVVFQEEVAGRGEAAPSAADSAATHDVLGGQAHQDLPAEDLLGKTEACRIWYYSREARHGCRPNAQRLILSKKMDGSVTMDGGFAFVVDALGFRSRLTATAGHRAPSLRTRADGARGEESRGRWGGDTRI
jgi:hypothetical protein